MKEQPQPVLRTSPLESRTVLAYSRPERRPEAVLEKSTARLV